MVEDCFESYDAAVNSALFIDTDPQSSAGTEATGTDRFPVQAAMLAGLVPDAKSLSRRVNGISYPDVGRYLEDVSMPDVSQHFEDVSTPNVSQQIPELSVPAVSDESRVETDTDVDRRAFLKAAGVSVTGAFGVSSGSSLYGESQGPQVHRQSYGYGGVPLNVTAGSLDSGGTASTATPTGTLETVTQTPTPTAPTPTPTPTPTETETDSGSSGSSGGSSDDSTTEATETTTETTETTTTTTETTTSSDNADSTTPTSVDRYNDEFEEVSQGYGEQGYGGVEA